MAARQEVTFIISARNRARAVFRSLRRNVANLTSSMRGLVGLLGAAFTIRNIDRTNQQLEAGASILGISIERLGALKQQAEEANIPFETLIDVLRQTSTNATNAARRGGDLLDAFREIGFDSPAELQAANIEEIFLRLANAAQQAFDSGRVNQFRGVLRRIAGETGVNLLALFDRRGPREIFEESQRLINEGVVRSGESVRELNRVSRDVTEELNRAATALNEAIAELTPAIVALSEVLQQAIEFYKQFDAQQAAQLARDTADIVQDATVGSPEQFRAELETLNIRRDAATTQVERQQLTTLIAIKEGINALEPGVFGR